jgi:hypothetical protein
MNEKNNSFDPVCGSDGRLYLSECKLQEEACLRQQKIEMVPLNNCLIYRNFSICNGSLPLFDKLTGKFIDCNIRSLLFKECPSFPSSSLDYTCIHHMKVISSIKTLLTYKDQDHFCCSKEDVGQSLLLNELSTIKQQSNEDECDCNKLGSEYPIRCDLKTKQCECKKGVIGLKCNRCQTGYYAFHKLNEGNNGCIPCECNKNGSLRLDCEQGK